MNFGAQPSIGRAVHYTSHGTPIREDGTRSSPPACRAAIITAVKDPAGQAGGGIADLAVLTPIGLLLNQDVSHADAEHHVGGTWHWPERVD